MLLYARSCILHIYIKNIIMKQQFYGIKYPFTTESKKLAFFDLNESREESVRSMLLHIILTPKGQRLRQPEFGTNLIKYIFEQNTEDDTWDSIKGEIKREVSKYLPEVVFNDINILHNTEEEHSIYIEVDYGVEYYGKITNNKVLVKL